MVIDNRRYEYDNDFNIVRERTEEEIEIIILKDSVTAHREWLEHLEELMVEIAFIVKDNSFNAGPAILKSLEKYEQNMENL